MQQLSRVPRVEKESNPDPQQYSTTEFQGMLLSAWRERNSLVVGSVSYGGDSTHDLNRAIVM